MELIAKIIAFIGVALVGVIGVGALVFVFSAIGAYFTMIAVNYLFTPAVILFLFGTAQLTFWKAFVLSILAGLLFSSRSVSSK